MRTKRKRVKTVETLRQCQAELDKIRKSTVSDDVKLVKQQTKSIKLYIENQADKLRDEYKRKITRIRSARDKLTKTTRKLQESRKRLNSLKQNLESHLKTVQDQMKRERQNVQRQIETCIIENKQYKETHIHRSSLFGRLATLLGQKQ